MLSRCAVVLLFALPATGQESVQAFVEAINESVRHQDRQAFAKLFTPDGDLWIGGRSVERDRYFSPRGIWTETTAPILIVRHIRMLTGEIALVDATRKQYGAMILSNAPVLLVLTRVDGVWRIATMRVLDHGYPIIQPAASGTPPRSRSPLQSGARTA